MYSIDRLSSNPIISLSQSLDCILIVIEQSDKPI